jgi:hypothetical protein
VHYAVKALGINALVYVPDYNGSISKKDYTRFAALEAAVTRLQTEQGQTIQAFGPDEKTVKQLESLLQDHTSGVFIIHAGSLKSDKYPYEFSTLTENPTLLPMWAHYCLIKAGMDEL